jgi:hypothetical protein
LFFFSFFFCFLIFPCKPCQIETREERERALKREVNYSPFSKNTFLCRTSKENSNGDVSSKPLPHLLRLPLQFWLRASDPCNTLIRSDAYRKLEDLTGIVGVEAEVSTDIDDFGDV